jgi:hypothetical protein
MMLARRMAIETLQYCTHRARQSRPVARLAQSLAQFKLHALARTTSVANVARVSTRESVPVNQAGESDLRESLRHRLLQPVIQPPE